VFHQDCCFTCISILEILDGRVGDESIDTVPIPDILDRLHVVIAIVLKCN